MRLLNSECERLREQVRILQQDAKDRDERTTRGNTTSTSTQEVADLEDKLLTVEGERDGARALAKTMMEERDVARKAVDTATAEKKGLAAELKAARTQDIADKTELKRLRKENNSAHVKIKDEKEKLRVEKA